MMSNSIYITLNWTEILTVLFFIYLSLRKMENWLIIFLMPGFPEDGVIRIPVFLFWYVPLFSKEEWQQLSWEVMAKLLLAYWETYTPYVYLMLGRTIKASIQYVCVLNDGTLTIFEDKIGCATIKAYFFIDYFYYGIRLTITV